MEITSVGMNNSNTLAKSEPVKQAAATEQQEVNTPKTKEVVADSFTKSAAADAISKQDKSTQSTDSQDALASSETEKQGTDNTSSNPKLETAKMPPKPTSSDSAKTEATDTNASVISNVTTETTTSTTATLPSVSEYTAAEIAEYDINGDGKIDTQEAAKMKAAQAKEASKDEMSADQIMGMEKPQAEMSVEQIEAKEAYENAKTQMLASDDESEINELV